MMIGWRKSKNTLTASIIHAFLFLHARQTETRMARNTCYEKALRNRHPRNLQASRGRGPLVHPGSCNFFFGSFSSSRKQQLPAAGTKRRPSEPTSKRIINHREHEDQDKAQAHESSLQRYDPHLGERSRLRHRGSARSTPRFAEFVNGLYETGFFRHNSVMRKK